MKRIFTSIIFSFLLIHYVAAQDAVRARIILIGDAGEIDQQQKMLIPDAAKRVLKGKTTAIYLGNNIYPNGMGLSGSGDELEGQKILKSQYETLRAAGSSVYFIPGNHDWDKSGPDGLAKIKRQWSFLESQQDSLLKLFPANGCPDPVAINVNDSMVVIFMDTEWWLFPFNKENKGADCNCGSTRDVMLSLRELLYRNRYKVVLLATHHPFETYGNHGGKFSFKDNVFPFTALSKNLYIPLPVVGSLYPLYRKTFTNPEDLHHPLYQNLIKNVDEVFKGFPNLIHVSGHEHGLQLIDDKENNIFQVVSGGGAKENYAMKGENSLFGKATQGYVVADLMENNNVHFTFYEYDNGVIKEAYKYDWTFKPYDKVEKYDEQKVTEDSIIARAHPAYEHNSGFYNFFFGKNYRAEWAAPVKLPVFHISEMNGGTLKPVKLGGGYQSTSLRFEDTVTGREYTLRTVEKSTDLVVPLPFQGTFVKELLDEATSEQHPYSALIVKPVMNALSIPAADPKVGVVAADKSMGMYSKLFEGKVALFEEREPLGDSKNSLKAFENLQEDNDNSFDAHNFSLARMADVLFADWDRHEDQWRFFNENKKGEDKFYIAIPRDRDMVLNATQGFLPTIAKRLFLMPRVYGFRDKINPGAKYYMYKSSFLNAHPASQISHEEWTKIAEEFQQKVTDSVLEVSMKGLPAEIYPLKHDEILEILKSRRNGMKKAMEGYYKFNNKIVDIHVSDKNEWISAKDITTENGTEITIRKISKKGELEDTLVYKIFPHSITKEIRIYLGKGNDSVIVDNQTSKVRLRIIGGKGKKTYDILQSRKKIKVYDHNEETYLGETNKLALHTSKDSMNTAFSRVNLFNTSLPLITGGINPDDGIILGLGMRFVHQEGFRQWPYSNAQQIMVSHSFTTKAFNIKYDGEWIKAIGNADITVDANIKAPDNTQNFFGRGNETPFVKNEGYQKYYRTRFSLIDFTPSLRWKNGRGSSLSVGPTAEYYHYSQNDNVGRFINNVNELHSYDSATIDQDKMHLGIKAQYTFDKRNNKLIPTWGAYFNVVVQADEGLNKYSKSFIKINPELALYKGLNAKQTIILADRIGGGVTLGSTTFYQSMFLGGQGNLFGYRQYRFAGQHSLYNNMELRILFPDFGNYILKGQFGIAGFYDIGRVWANDEHSSKWHDGVGAGVFLCPAGLAVFRFNMAYSEEGWYPTFSMGFRF
jgi:hypothetical protein